MKNWTKSELESFYELKIILNTSLHYQLINLNVDFTLIETIIANHVEWIRLILYSNNAGRGSIKVYNYKPMASLIISKAKLIQNSRLQFKQSWINFQLIFSMNII